MIKMRTMDRKIKMKVVGTPIDVSAEMIRFVIGFLDGLSRSAGKERAGATVCALIVAVWRWMQEHYEAADAASWRLALELEIMDNAEDMHEKATD